MSNSLANLRPLRGRTFLENIIFYKHLTPDGVIQKTLHDIELYIIDSHPITYKK